jgi:thiol-disulfide isomerase/thioredoxin
MRTAILLGTAAACIAVGAIGPAYSDGAKIDLGAAIRQDQQHPPPLQNGSVAPDFTAWDPWNRPVHLSDYAGYVVVVDFWATWCGPCQQSLPSTNQVARQYAQENVAFLGVNVWDKPNAFLNWLPQHQNLDSIRFVIDPSPTGRDVATQLYNVWGIPTQYVIGADGKVYGCVVGMNEDALVAAIKAALVAEAPPTTPPAQPAAPASPATPAQPAAPPSPATPASPAVPAQPATPATPAPSAK